MDISAWPGLVLEEPVAGGNRNEVWRGSIDGHHVAVRRSRRDAASLAWELQLIDFLAGNGFAVPTVVRTLDGAHSAGGVVVQNWIDGQEPATDADWIKVGETLQRLHRLTVDYPQRPGCCTVRELNARRISGDADLNAMPAADATLVTSVFAEFDAVPAAVVHGDVWAPNLRILHDGGVGLLDWDESRVDLTWHDLSPLPMPVLAPDQHAAAARLSHAWEAVNGWKLEPAYAKRRLQALRSADQ